MQQYTGQPVRVNAPELPRRLVERMSDRGLSVRALADASSVNKTTINAWRKGHSSDVQVDLVRRVAAVLQTTPEHLLDFPADLSDMGRPARQPVPGIDLLVDRLEGLLQEVGSAIDVARQVGADKT